MASLNFPRSRRAVASRKWAKKAFGARATARRPGQVRLRDGFAQGMSRINLN